MVGDLIRCNFLLFGKTASGFAGEAELFLVSSCPAPVSVIC
jgi:hypothetical protein